MEEALRPGAGAVGGIPHYERTRELGVESVKETFRLAGKHDKLIDVHCDETDDPHSRFLEVMAAEAIRIGMGGRVTASHTTAFGSYDNAFKLMGFPVKSGINVVANPLVNIYYALYRLGMGAQRESARDELGEPARGGR